MRTEGLTQVLRAAVAGFASLVAAACNAGPGSGGVSPMRCSEAEVLDGAICVPAACGSGPWGDVDGAAVHVDAAAMADGTGSDAAPFLTIQQGVDAAAALGGGAVAVAAGTYVEAVSMTADHDGVRLAGRCKDLVIVDGNGTANKPVLQILGPGDPVVALSGLTVRGGDDGGVWAESATVSLTDVDIIDNAHNGLVAWGTLGLERVTISGTTAKGGGTGYGIDLEGPATITATDCLLLNNTTSGIFATGHDASGTFSATTVQDTVESSDYDAGVWVQNGAVLTIVDSNVRGNAETGLVVYGAGATVSFTDSTISDTLPSGSHVGWGADVQMGGKLTITRSTVERSNDAGIYATDANTGLLIEESVIQDNAGRGLAVQDGATVTVTDSTFQRNGEVGVFVSDAGTVVQLSGSSILDTLASSDGTGGRGLAVEYGASVIVSGSTIQGNREMGASVTSEGSTLELSDSVILDTLPDGAGFGGVGVLVDEGGALTVIRTTLERNTAAGVYARGAGTTAEVIDSSVLDTASQTDGTLGRGIQAEAGATLSATGCSVQRSAEFGAAATGSGTVMDLTDCDVGATAPLTDGSGGPGLGASDGATVRATRCVIHQNTRLGVFASDAGTLLELDATSISDTAPAPDGSGGGGLGLLLGAQATGTGLIIAGSTSFGVLLDGADTSLALSESSVSDTGFGRSLAVALGVVVQEGAVLTLDDSSVSGTAGPGIYVTADGSVDCQGCTLSDNAFAGVLLTNGSLALHASTVNGITSSAEFGGGFGVYASSLLGPPSLLLTESTLGPAPYAALWLDGPGAYDVQGCDLSGGPGVISGGTSGATLHGNAVFAENGVTAWNGDSGLHLADNALHDAHNDAVFLQASTGTLERTTWSGNGTDLRQQSCEGIPAMEIPEGATTTAICPTENRLFAYDIDFTTLGLRDIETGD